MATAIKPILLNTNNTTDVDILTGPASLRYACNYLSFYNADTAAVVLTYKYDNNGTEYIICKATLQPGETLVWGAEGEGQVVDAATKKLQAVLAGNVATNQVQITGNYLEVS